MVKLENMIRDAMNKSRTEPQTPPRAFYSKQLTESQPLDPADEPYEDEKTPEEEFLQFVGNYREIIDATNNINAQGTKLVTSKTGEREDDEDHTEIVRHREIGIAQDARETLMSLCNIGDTTKWTEADWLRNTDRIREFATEAAASYFRPVRDKIVDKISSKGLEKKVFQITPIQIEGDERHNAAYDLHMSWKEVANLNAAHAKGKIGKEYASKIAEMVAESVRDSFAQAGYDKYMQDLVARMIVEQIRSGEEHAVIEGQYLQLKRQNILTSYLNSNEYTKLYVQETLKEVGKHPKKGEMDDALGMTRAMEETAACLEPDRDG